MVDDATLHQLSLSRDEYRLILDRFGREPNEVELGMIGALWRGVSCQAGGAPASA
jgi:phosphoribosylformylglycinamidine (FGAM) synthase-like enzyme